MNKLSLMVVLAALLSGCGVNYVAKDKSFGTPQNKKPVVGVAVVGFTLNSQVNISGSPIANQLAQDMVTTFQENGVSAKVVPYEAMKGSQLAPAEAKYTSIPLLMRKKIDGGYEFGQLSGDLDKIGVEALMFVSGDATVSSGSLGQLAAMTGLNAATVMLGGIAFGSNPLVWTNTTVVNGQGTPLYVNNEMFGNIGKRDFSDADHRKKFARDIAEGVAKNLF